MFDLGMLVMMVVCWSLVEVLDGVWYGVVIFVVLLVVIGVVSVIRVLLIWDIEVVVCGLLLWFEGYWLL